MHGVLSTMRKVTKLLNLFSSGWLLNLSLLSARLKNGKSFPLAVASYPDKGRAIWLFSDSLWKFAINNKGSVSRNLYNHFLQNSMTWLSRDEVQKPLIINDFQIFLSSDEQAKWKILLRGPSVSYFDLDSEHWNISVCSVQLGLNKVESSLLGPSLLELRGNLPVKPHSGSSCVAEITGFNRSFGHINASYTTHHPLVVRDELLVNASHNIVNFTKSLVAELVYLDKSSEVKVKQWVESKVFSHSHSYDKITMNKISHYWFLNLWYSFFFLFFIPLEIFFRRF